MQKYEDADAAAAAAIRASWEAAEAFEDFWKSRGIVRDRSRSVFLFNASVSYTTSNTVERLNTRVRLRYQGHNVRKIMIESKAKIDAKILPVRVFSSWSSYSFRDDDGALLINNISAYPKIYQIEIVPRIKWLSGLTLAHLISAMPE